jgi:hypothetical protein
VWSKCKRNSLEDVSTGNCVMWGLSLAIRPFCRPLVILEFIHGSSVSKWIRVDPLNRLRFRARCRSSSTLETWRLYLAVKKVLFKDSRRAFPKFKIENLKNKVILKNRTFLNRSPNWVDLRVFPRLESQNDFALVIARVDYAPAIVQSQQLMKERIFARWAGAAHESKGTRKTGSSGCGIHKRRPRNEHPQRPQLSDGLRRSEGQANDLRYRRQGCHYAGKALWARCKHSMRIPNKVTRRFGAPYAKPSGAGEKIRERPTRKLCA